MADGIVSNDGVVIEGEFRDMPERVKASVKCANGWVIHLDIDRKAVILEAADRLEEMGESKRAQELRLKINEIVFFGSFNDMSAYASQNMGMNESGLKDEFFLIEAAAAQRTDREDMKLVGVNLPNLLRGVVQDDFVDTKKLHQRISGNLLHELAHLGENERELNEILRYKKRLNRLAGVAAGLLSAITVTQDLSTFQTIVQIFGIATMSPIATQFLGYVLQGEERVANRFNDQELSEMALKVQLSRYEERKIQLSNPIVYQEKEVEIIEHKRPRIG